MIAPRESLHFATRGVAKGEAWGMSALQDPTSLTVNVSVVTAPDIEQVILWVKVIIGFDRPRMLPVAFALPLHPDGRLPRSGPLTVRLLPSDTTVRLPVNAG